MVRVSSMPFWPLTWVLAPYRLSKNDTLDIIKTGYGSYMSSTYGCWRRLRVLQWSNTCHRVFCSQVRRENSRLWSNRSNMTFVAIAASLTTLEQSCQSLKTCYALSSFLNLWTALRWKRKWPNLNGNRKSQPSVSSFQYNKSLTYKLKITSTPVTSE